MEKIVILSNMYPTKNHPTFGIFVKNQVEQLKNAGMNVEVIAIDEPGKGKVLTIKKYLSWFMRSMAFLMKNKNEISLTHAHYAFPTGVLSFIGKKVFNIPYVVTVHGGDIDKMAKKNVVINRMTRRILTNASQVIVVGERLKKEVIRGFHVQEARVDVLSMGVDTSVFKKHSQEEVRKELGIPLAEKIVLFVGNVIREKGVSELIQAYGKMKQQYGESRLYIVGSQRDTQFVEELTEVIRKEGIHDVYFHQPLSQEQLAKWMSAADVLALPSYHEGFGLVALEAMATGTPVVGSDVGGLSYLLNDGAGILTRPKEVASLAEGLVKAIERKGIQKEKMEKVVEKHATTTILKKIQSIYENIRR